MPIRLQPARAAEKNRQGDAAFYKQDTPNGVTSQRATAMTRTRQRRATAESRPKSNASQAEAFPGKDECPAAAFASGAHRVSDLVRGSPGRRKSGRGTAAV